MGKTTLNSVAFLGRAAKGTASLTSAVAMEASTAARKVVHTAARAVDVVAVQQAVAVVQAGASAVQPAVAVVQAGASSASTAVQAGASSASHESHRRVTSAVQHTVAAVTHAESAGAHTLRSTAHAVHSSISAGATTMTVSMAAHSPHLRPKSVASARQSTSEAADLPKRPSAAYVDKIRSKHTRNGQQLAVSKQ